MLCRVSGLKTSRSTEGRRRGRHVTRCSTQVQRFFDVGQLEAAVMCRSLAHRDYVQAIQCTREDRRSSQQWSGPRKSKSDSDPISCRAQVLGNLRILIDCWHSGGISCNDDCTRKIRAESFQFSSSTPGSSSSFQNEPRAEQAHRECIYAAKPIPPRVCASTDGQCAQHAIRRAPDRTRCKRIGKMSEMFT